MARQTIQQACDAVLEQYDSINGINSIGIGAPCNGGHTGVVIISEKSVPMNIQQDMRRIVEPHTIYFRVEKNG